MEPQKGQLYLADEHIINVQDYDQEFAFGFDLLTEKLVKVQRSQLMPVKNSVYKLLTNVSAQYFLVRHISKHGNDMAEKMNISTRTFFRMQKDIEGTTGKSKTILEEK